MRHKIVISLIILSSGTLFTSPAYAWENTTTHPGLTQEIVAFYNLNYPDKIDSKLAESLIRGSIDEDVPVFRAANHFYDPIHNISWNNNYTAKDWAISPIIQNNTLYTDYSYPKAIETYANNSTEDAYFALGHVMHLVEDMAVPNHTRNDPHAKDDATGASPYEIWADKAETRATMAGYGTQLYNAGYKAIEYSDLGQYFDYMANYSNKNFVSEDTIFRSDYSLPSTSRADEKYVYSMGTLDNEEHKIYIRKFDNKTKIYETYLYKPKEDESVVLSAWSRLSTQNIRVGAGVLHLFVQQAAKAKAEHDAEAARQKAQAELTAQIRKDTLASLNPLEYLVYQSSLKLAWVDNVPKTIGNGIEVVSSKTIATVQAIGNFAPFTIATGVKDVKIAANKMADNIIVVTPGFYGSIGSLDFSPKVVMATPSPFLTQANQAKINDINKMLADLQIQRDRIAAEERVAREKQQKLDEEKYLKNRTVTLANTPTVKKNPNAYQPGFGGGGGPALEAKFLETIEVSPPTVPDAPTSLIASSGDTKVMLSWYEPDPPTDGGGADITDYEIHESLDNFDKNDDILVDGISDATSTLVTDLTNGKLYSFKVFAVNRVGTSTLATNVVSAKPVAPALTKTIPAMPTNVRQVLDDTCNIAIQWKLPANDGGDPIIGYEVQYSTDDTFTTYDNSIGEITFVNNEASTTLNNVIEFNWYSVRVLAGNSIGMSSPGVAADQATLVCGFL